MKTEIQTMLRSLADSVPDDPRHRYGDEFTYEINSPRGSLTISGIKREKGQGGGETVIFDDAKFKFASGCRTEASAFEAAIIRAAAAGLCLFIKANDPDLVPRATRLADALERHTICFSDGEPLSETDQTLLVLGFNATIRRMNDFSDYTMAVDKAMGELARIPTDDDFLAVKDRIERYGLGLSKNPEGDQK